MTLLSGVTEICSSTNEPHITTDSLDDAFFFFFSFFFFKGRASETDKSFARCQSKSPNSRRWPMDGRKCHNEAQGTEDINYD